MFPAVSSARLASRFTAVAERLAPVDPGTRVDAAQRRLLAAIETQAPAMLGQVAAAFGRGAPAVSRAVDTLVRSGLVERMADPHNRRRLALRLTDEGRNRLTAAPAGNSRLEQKLARVPQSELRALERAIEILERLPD